MKRFDQWADAVRSELGKAGIRPHAITSAELRAAFSNHERPEYVAKTFAEYYGEHCSEYVKDHCEA